MKNLKSNLEKAAKAVGIVGHFSDKFQAIECLDQQADDGLNKLWAPHARDDEAQRLSVDLAMNVFHVRNSVYAMLSEDEDEREVQVSYEDCAGKYQATRFAIVMLAALVYADFANRPENAE